MAFDPDKLFALHIPEAKHGYGWRDTILYALGVGFGLDPLDERQLAFVDETKLKASPTMACVLGHPGFWIRNLDTGIDWVRVVHAEQSIELHHPVATHGEVRATTRIMEIVDKGAGKGALLRYGREILDAKSGECIASVVQTTFCRGDGGFGGTSTSAHVSPATPDRAPDTTVEMATYPQMALLYRLSGDLNPLHSDPATARKAGFDRPILHGLATYGVAGHALMAALCEYDPVRVQSMSARFSAPVFPGDTIAVDIWREGDGKAAFRARVPARDAVVLTNGAFGYAD